LKKDKQIIFLIGPKGSGKTSVGKIMADIFQIPFLRIESVWEAVRHRRREYDTPDYIDMPCYLEEVRDSCLEAVDKELSSQKEIILETTGAFFFKEYLSSLRARGDVLLVKVHAEMETCLDRIKRRDQSLQIPIAECKIREINSQSMALEQDWDVILKNEPCLIKRGYCCCFREVYFRLKIVPAYFCEK